MDQVYTRLHIHHYIESNEIEVQMGFLGSIGRGCKLKIFTLLLLKVTIKKF
jgi:hypothetical protein